MELTLAVAIASLISGFIVISYNIFSSVQIFAGLFQ